VTSPVVFEAAIRLGLGLQNACDKIMFENQKNYYANTTNIL